MSEIEKIMKNAVHFPDGEWKDAGDVWRTSCICTSPDHSLSFYVDVDKDSTDRVSLYATFNTYRICDVWGEPSWSQKIRSFWKRLKTACTVMCKGYVEMEGDFIFRGDEQIDALCEKMQEAKRITTNVVQTKKEN